MNEAQQNAYDQMLVQFEQAARIYCKKANYDPDLRIPAPHPLGLNVPYSIPQWHNVAEDLYDLASKLASIKEAATDKKVLTQ